MGADLIAQDSVTEDRAAGGAAPERADPSLALFDALHYGRQGGLIAEPAEALADYRRRGEAAGYCPHPLFMPSHVARQLGLAAPVAGGTCILDAYAAAASGGRAIDPHPLFDSAYYASVAGPFAAGQTALGHYIAQLAAGLVPPSPTKLFDRAHYGVMPPGECGLLHYLAQGAQERRSPHPLFAPHQFLNGCARAGIRFGLDTDALLLYLADRRSWPVPTHTLFDPADYAAALAEAGYAPWDFDAATMPPLAHFLAQGGTVSTHFAFDPEFYRRHAASRGIRLGEAPVIHHIRTRGRSGIAPHPLFSPAYYLANYADVQGSTLDPLQHFLRHGRFELRNPHPLVMLKSLTALPGEDSLPESDRFRRYLEPGAKALAASHALFDAELYAAAHPDCLLPGATPLGHFVKRWSEQGVFCPPWGTALFERRPAAKAAGRVDLIVVSHELTRTGAPLILLALVKAFVERLGLGCLVITQRGGVLLEAFREWAPVIDLSVVQEAGVPQDVFVRNCIAAFEGADKPRLALVNTACVEQIGKSLAMAGLAVITLVHELAAAFDRQVFDTIYDTSAAVIYPAAFVRREAHITHALPIEKTECLPQGLLDPRFGTGDRIAARRDMLELLDAPEDAFVVLGCGSLDLRKGIDIFASAAIAAIAVQDEAGQPGRPLHFVWVGGGPTHRHSAAWYVQEDILRASREWRIRFIGAHTRTEPFFLGSDAFALTSRQDPFPCVVHEAMACGLPVVAFADAGGAPEALEDGAGLVVPYGDVAALARALVHLASSPEEASAIGDRARARVRARYDFAAYADGVLEVFARRCGVPLADKAGRRAGAASAARGRIIFTLPRARRDREGRSVELLIDGLCRRGFDAELILTAPRADTERSAILGGTKRRLLATSLRRTENPGLIAERLATVLDTASPAILVPGSDGLAASLLPVLPARVGVLGQVTRDGTDMFERASQLGRFWQRVVVPAEAVAAGLRAAVPALVGRCEIIPPALLPAPAPIMADEAVPVRVLCLLPAHDSGRDMRPMAALINRLAGEDCVIRVLGTAVEADSLAGIFGAHVVSGRLQTEMYADEAALQTVLQQAEVFVTLDDLAGTPIGIGDAMGAGLAVIDAAGRGAGDAWQKDGAGCLSVPRGDLGAIAGAVAALAADRPRLLRMREAAQAQARAQCVGMEENLDRYAALFEQMLHEVEDGRQKEVLF